MPNYHIFKKLAPSFSEQSAFESKTRDKFSHFDTFESGKNYHERLNIGLMIYVIMYHEGKSDNANFVLGSIIKTGIGTVSGSIIKTGIGTA